MSEAMTERLAVDDLTFEVRRSPRRKTLEITLDRGGELIVTAPPGVTDEEMASFVRDKKFWLSTPRSRRRSPASGPWLARSS